MIGTPSEIALAMCTAVIGVFCLVASFEGYMVVHYGVPERVLLGIAALCTIIPGLATDLFGFAMIAVAVVITLIRRRRDS